MYCVYAADDDDVNNMSRERSTIQPVMLDGDSVDD